MSWCPALSKRPDRVHRWLVWPLGVSSSFPPFNPFWSLLFWDLGTLVSVGGLRGVRAPHGESRAAEWPGLGEAALDGYLVLRAPPSHFQELPSFS